MSLDVYLKVNFRVVYEDNITHNLGRMAEEAGIYYHLWRPDELEIQTAQELIAPLEEGLRKLVADPNHMKKFNPENKWGTYYSLLIFVACYLQACEENPEATVSVCR